MELEQIAVKGTDYDIRDSRITGIDDSPTENSTNVVKSGGIKTYIDTETDKKVDKVTGKGLSSNDYTTAEKTKLSGIASNAQVNVLEGVKVDGTELPITDKKVNIDLSGKVDVASHQSQADQSFVFRQTGGGNLTVDAKNSELISIKGKTLVWNQLVQNWNFVDGNNILLTNCTLQISDNIGTITKTDTSTYALLKFIGETWILEHKYYCRGGVKFEETSEGKVYFRDPATTNNKYTFSANTTEWQIGSFIVSCKQSDISSDISLGVFINSSVSGNVKLRDIILIDLTLMFGAGNEPSTVEEFEALFPNPYYEYNAGTLISNKAEELVTVGFNQWDEEWEIGGYNVDNGLPNDVGTLLRSKANSPIRVLPNTSYYTKYGSATPSSRVIIFFYDATMQFISRLSGANSTNVIWTTPQNCYYVRFYVETTTYNHDICINLSDPAKNGTYEPYRKSTLNLGLNAIKVNSHNIWDEEWEDKTINPNDGTKSSSSTNRCTKNFIPVIPGETYYIYSKALVGETGNSLVLHGYTDDNYNGHIVIKPNAQNAKIVIPSGIRFIQFNTLPPTFDQPICVNISSSFNGQYEPYGMLTITGGLKSAGSAYDEIVGKKYIKRIGSVDLGELGGNWSYGEQDGKRYFYDANTAPAGIKPNTQNVVTSKGYKPVVPSVSNLVDNPKCIGISGSGYVFIHDTDYDTATAEQFKTAMSGVMLYYELATPVEYDLVEPIRTDSPVDKLGTERVISDTVPTPPFRADITYHEANIKDIEIEGITDYLKREELTDELDKLDTIEAGAQVNKIEHIQINGTEQTITNKTVNLPAYPTTLPASDVYDWAKASTKPSYNFGEIGGTVADSQLPDTISSDITGTAMGLKTEKLTSQEFVYRATPNTIKAKSFALDRIYGKTLVWNQLFEPTPIERSSEGITVTPLGNGKIRIHGTADSDVSSLNIGLKYPEAIVNHKYLLTGPNNSNDNCYLMWVGLGVYASNGVVIATCTTPGSLNDVRVRRNNGAVIDWTGYVIAIDLTLMFGSGNEPSTVAEFESMFPGYHDYSAGKLISNDAKSIETVGFNQWDEEWTLGELYVDTVNSKNLTPIIPSVNYQITYVGTNTNVSVAYAVFYDAEKNLLPNQNSSGGSITLNEPFTPPVGAYYVKFRMQQQYGTMYGHDICLNLSDPAKNGTYEPYRKSTMQLNLSSFQVLDSQGNVTTIEGGLKSAGNVYDEIVGNKYIKRVGSVDLGTLNWIRILSQSRNTYYFRSAINNGLFAGSSPNDNVKHTTRYQFVIRVENFGYENLTALYGVKWDKGYNIYIRDDDYTDDTTFKAAMSGVMLYYELATPEEYTLVSPLVPTMKAGETEARISPNADGLSAPFCADMTYSVADYIEYADRAGALVKGASVDLTDIVANGELSGNAFKAIAEHIAKLTTRVEVLEAGVGTVDTLTSTSVDSANGYYINGDKTVLHGAGAPSMVPGFIGQFYVDTTNKKLYVATGNSSSSNWTLLN